MSPNTVTLTVDGTDYAGWQAININRGIEQVAGTFELTVTERWPGSDTARRIQPGAACTVAIDDDYIITGYIDDVLISCDSLSHSVTIRGRDKTGDLVDCSAIHKTGSWTNKKLNEIAADLCEPFGVSVYAYVEYIGEPFATAAIEQGETVFELLERLARQRGVLLTSNNTGNLVITRAANKAKNTVLTVLKDGENIIQASVSNSNRDRYSLYIGKGQSAGSDGLFGAAANEPSAMVNDIHIRRYRPLIVFGEDNATIDSLTKRVTWQRNVNYGRGTNVQITVAAWRQNTMLWQPNELVKIDSGLLGINDIRLISNVNYTLDDSGTKTTLTLKNREAFDVLDIPEPADENENEGF